MERQPGVIAGDPCRIGASADGYAKLEHLPDGWRLLGHLPAVARHEMLALEDHPVLDRNSAPERSHPLQVARGDRLGVVEPPAEAGERHLAIHGLEDVQEAADGFVVRGVEPERPAVADQERNGLAQPFFHGARQFGSRLHEVLEVAGRPDDVLPGPVHPVEVVALARFCHLDPPLQVGDLLARLLGEQVVGDTQGQQPLAVEGGDHLVVVGVRLRSTAGIDDAGQAEPIELAHELSCRVALIVSGQPRAPGKRRVEDHRARLCQQQPGRIAPVVPLNLAARRVRRLARVTQRS